MSREAMPIQLENWDILGLGNIRRHGAQWAHGGEFECYPPPDPLDLFPLERNNPAHLADEFYMVDSIEVNIRHWAKFEQRHSIFFDGRHHSLPKGFQFFALRGGRLSPNEFPIPAQHLKTHGGNVSRKKVASATFGQIRRAA